MAKWRKVVGYPAYFVSDDGRVRRASRELKLWLNGVYLAVHLYVNNARKTRLVHSLVLAAFHGKRPKGSVARHLDGQRHNNRANNLRWGTPSENTVDSVRHGTHPGLRRKGEKHPLAQLVLGDVERIRDMGCLRVSQYDIARWFGVSRSCIQSVLEGRTWRHV